MPMQAVGQGMQIMGEALMDLGVRRQQFENNAFETDFKVQFAKGATQLASDLTQRKFTDLQGADGTNYGSEQINSFLQKHKDEADRIGQGNPMLSRKMKETIAQGEIHLNGQYSQIHDAKFKDYQRAGSDEFLKLQGESYQSAEGHPERMAVLTDGFNKINDLVSSGALTMEQGVKEKQVWATTTHQQYIKSKLERMPWIAAGTPEQVQKFMADMVDPVLYPFLDQKARNEIVGMFAAVRKAQFETFAYEDAAKTWTDPKVARVQVLSPEFMRKWNLDVNQAQNLSASFHVIGAEQEKAKKDLQEKNLDDIMAVAIKNPAKALAMIREAPGLDPQKAVTTQRAIENHIKTMSLMNAQERSIQMDIDDKKKAQIKVNIDAGKYKTWKEVQDAALAAGVSNTSGFLDDIRGNFNNFKKDAGGLNYFKAADEDWDRLISTTKSPAKKRELQDMKTGMLKTLQSQMERDGLRVSDPQVFELYRANRKALTQTWFQKAMDTVMFKPGEGVNTGGDRSGVYMEGDSFVDRRGTAPAMTETVQGPTTRAMAKSVVNTGGVMDEATARQRLTAKGVKGSSQDIWIQRYRDQGVVQ